MTFRKKKTETKVRTTTMTQTQIIISNDDLYTQYPSVHEMAINSFDEITEENYAAVESWLAVEEDGEVTGVIKPIFADWYQEMLDLL